VIIVDDLIQSGGTLIECIKVLSAAKATKISAYVTHPVFPKQSWRRFLLESNEVMLDKFWITDSIPHARDIATHPPFQ
jgi:phosphoribosylpyrophosphate synthetase